MRRRRVSRVTLKTLEALEVMTITERPSGGVVILDVDGRMTLETTETAGLADTSRRLLTEGRRQILVNLERVSSIDSTGVRDIVESYVTATRQQGRLKLVSLSVRVQNVLSVTKLLTILEAYDNEAAALASFDTGVKA